MQVGLERTYAFKVSWLQSQIGFLEVENFWTKYKSKITFWIFGKVYL